MLGSIEPDGLIARFACRLEFQLSRLFGGMLRASLERRKEAILAVGARGYRRSVEEVGFSAEMLDYVQRCSRQQAEVVVASIDQDGFFSAATPLFERAPVAPDAKFMQRQKFEMFVVVHEGIVGVRKCYGSRAHAFITELTCLTMLGEAGCNVPAVLAVDFRQLSITMSYIHGEVLREKLAHCGARLRDRDQPSTPPASRQEASERRQRRIEEGWKHLEQVVGGDFAAKAFRELKRVHAAGIAMIDVKYGNIMVECSTDEPYFIDFELSRFSPWGLGRARIKAYQEQDTRELRHLFKPLHQVGANLE